MIVLLIFNFNILKKVKFDVLKLILNEIVLLSKVRVIVATAS